MSFYPAIEAERLDERDFKLRFPITPPGFQCPRYVTVQSWEHLMTLLETAHEAEEAQSHPEATR